MDVPTHLTTKIHHIHRIFLSPDSPFLSPFFIDVLSTGYSSDRVLVITTKGSPTENITSKNNFQSFISNKKNEQITLNLWAC